MKEAETLNEHEPTKQRFSIDIASNAKSSLEAHEALALCRRESCYHEARSLRMPLGIYNVSVSRVCDKVMRLCSRLEQYFKNTDGAYPSRSDDDLMQEVIDYIELALYSAAEHVDDIDAIASGFFANRALRDKSKEFRQLQNQIKRHKRFLSAAANAIKHQQARIRLYSLEYTHLEKSGCLHGYFIEGVRDGVVLPSEIFHKDQQVFSVTSLAWEIIVFLLECSRALKVFIGEVPKESVASQEGSFSPFSKATVAAARLPLYTFGEEHPFSRVVVKISSSDGSEEDLQSELYGSIKNRWVDGGKLKFGRFAARYVGDGVTRSFNYPAPKSVSLVHWG